MFVCLQCHKTKTKIYKNEEFIKQHNFKQFTRLQTNKQKHERRFVSTYKPSTAIYEDERRQTTQL